MVYQILTRKDIKEMCGWLEFYDKFHKFPFQKKKVCITIDAIVYDRLKNVKNKSQFVNDVLSRSL